MLQSLNKQDQLFLKNQNPEINLPRARVLDGELHLVSKAGMLKITVLDLQQGKFEINNHIWQLSKPLQLKKDLVKIDQILKKAHVMGTDTLNSADSGQNALAIYGFSYLATSKN